MKNIILIETKDQIKLGDVCKNSYGTMYIVDNEHELSTARDYIQSGDVNKQYIYVIDSEAEIKDGDYILSDTKGGVLKQCDNKHSYYNEDNLYNHHSLCKVIATNDSSLPLPQLRKEDIKMIVDKKGSIGEFDVEFDYEEDTTKEYVIGVGQPAFKIANIILKQTNLDLICNVCGGTAIPSKAIVSYHNVQTSDVSKEFQTKLINVNKCKDCGHSWKPEGLVDSVLDNDYNVMLSSEMINDFLNLTETNEGTYDRYLVSDKELEETAEEYVNVIKSETDYNEKSIHLKEAVKFGFKYCENILKPIILEQHELIVQQKIWRKNSKI